jgi:predicted amidohydrolase YtcJ
MLRDFTLRGVALQDFRHREEPLFDITFRRGRVAHLKRLPEGAPRSLFLTPGFRDAHLHPLHLGLARVRCDLSGCGSLDEALAALREFAQGRTPTDGAIWAVNFDESTWPEDQRPTRAVLDGVVADIPVIMRRICGHQAVLNSRALEEAGRQWSDIDPSGTLGEEQSMALSQIWPPTLEELEQAFITAQDAAIAMGITRIADMGGTGALAAYLSLAERGQLKIDVDLYVPPDGLERMVALGADGVGRDSRLGLTGIKLFADGSVGARTAALREPYADCDHAGRLLQDDATLVDVLTRALAADLRVAIHAIGDAALDQAVRCLEQSVESCGWSSALRASIEHAEMVDTELLDRIEALRAGLGCQPNFAIRWGRPGGLYERALGAERCARMNPLRSIWDRGVPLLFGSDGMPMDPALGLRGAVRHPVESARLTPSEALTAYLGGRGAPPGAWEVGDWWVPGCNGAVLYDRDPLDLLSGDLAHAPVRGVLWHGEWVLEPSAELFQSGVIHAE